MEQVHGVDVRWMTQGSFKEKLNKPFSAPDKTPSPQPRQLPTDSTQASANTSPAVPTGDNSRTSEPKPSSPIPITTHGSNTSSRQSQSVSVEKSSLSSNGASPGSHRRSSWFSNISAKFSSSSSNLQTTSVSAHQNHHFGHLSPQNQPQSSSLPSSQSLSLAQLEAVPRTGINRNAVLPHASKPEGDGPYTPAPPKSGQAGLLGVFRRLSSAGISTSPNGKLSHGLVERKVLNVDPNRERCPITELKDNKLRRVSFCVDVEIAPMPKYADAGAGSKPPGKAQKKMPDKGEGEALKNPKVAEAQKEAESPNGQESQEAKPQNDEGSPSAPDADAPKVEEGGLPASPPKEMTRKKEKKKKSEEERKARKEKRRKLAEANGSIPVEIQCDSSDSSDSPDGLGTPKTTTFPTTNPVRIYRRCCQLRESPILKKITEQLNDPANTSPQTGFVDRLDLAGYYMQLADLVTLGDYLAVVPVREVILDNSGLTDEGLRVILAGLLAAKHPELGRRRTKLDVERQGGVVERLSLKQNTLGIDGWKHISLFIYMSKSLKQLDVSKIPFPQQPALKNDGLLCGQIPLGIADVLAKAFAERPAGSTLEMVNMGETGPRMDQLGAIIDGLIQCGVARLGVANNHLDGAGLRHVARYLEAGQCEGLDIGGNDLRGGMDIIASSIRGEAPLWAISLAGCSLVPSALCQILPVLTRLKNLRFIDLSHNRDLFPSDSKPSAVGLLRRYLPKMAVLKRLHLQDVNMTAQQAIAIVEVVPEVHSLCHINLLENAEITQLADAKTEAAKEEACALYASLMAATRISKSIICVDIEVPSAEASEVVKAMAKQVVAYCLRNMEQAHDIEIGSAMAPVLAELHAESRQGGKPASYPEVIAHLVGHDSPEGMAADEYENDETTADEDYMIGGTGVVKALTFCLANRGDDSGGGSGDVSHDEGGGGMESQEVRLATGGKARDLSKHLLAGARKIRQRLQPALNKAKASSSDEINLRKLAFLDETLQGIIKRFEDEYPDTRESSSSSGEEEGAQRMARGDANDAEPLASPTSDDVAAAGSDGEDETKIHAAKPLSRANSKLSKELKELSEEEGRVHRAGHQFRQGVLAETGRGIDDIGADPNHIRILEDLAEDVGGELLEKVKEKGVIRAFKEHKDLTVKGIKESDLDYWPKFVESQQKAQANMKVPESRVALPYSAVSESAIED